MFFKVIPVCLLVCTLLLSVLCYTLEPETEILEKKFTGNTLILPYASYASETGFLIGLVGTLNRLSFFQENDNAILVSSIQYTQKKQLSTNFVIKYQTDEKRRQTGLDFSYKHWPNSFYGVGINTRKSEEEDYTSKKLEIDWDLRQRFLEKTSLGILLSYGNYSLKDLEDAPILSSGEVTGSNGGELTGGGLSLSRDSRNSNFLVTEGNYIELRLLHYTDIIGDFRYNQLTFDYRLFRTINAKNSVAFQLFTGTQGNNSPFQRMFQLGDFLRAYPTNRYIDRNIAILRSEYRLFPFTGQFWSRIGVVLFAGTGSVFDEWDSWSIGNQKFSYGLGGRFRLSKNLESPYLRFDLGFSSESINIMFIGVEAF